ncbi:hypothetical protein ACYZT9_14020 [Pseudomonas sp. ZT5P21]
MARKTVFVQALEKQGYSFVSSSNYGLQGAGRNLLPHAMENTCAAIEQSKAGEGESLSGLVRMGVTEGCGSTMLALQLFSITKR